MKNAQFRKISILLNILSQLKYAPGYNEDIALRRNCTNELNTKAATISIAVG